MQIAYHLSLIPYMFSKKSPTQKISDFKITFTKPKAKIKRSPEEVARRAKAMWLGALGMTDKV